MEINRPFFENWDTIDCDDFRKVVNSPGFKVVMARIEAEKLRYTSTCVRSHDQVEVLRAQGAVHALEAALATGPRMIEEMTLQKNKHKA